MKETNEIISSLQKLRWEKEEGGGVVPGVGTDISCSSWKIKEKVLHCSPWREWYWNRYLHWRPWKALHWSRCIFPEVNCIPWVGPMLEQRKSKSVKRKKWQRKTIMTWPQLPPFPKPHPALLKGRRWRSWDFPGYFLLLFFWGQVIREQLGGHLAPGQGQPVAFCGENTVPTFVASHLCSLYWCYHQLLSFLSVFYPF